MVLDGPLDVFVKSQSETEMFRMPPLISEPMAQPAASLRETWGFGRISGSVFSLVAASRLLLSALTAAIEWP